MVCSEFKKELDGCISAMRKRILDAGDSASYAYCCLLYGANPSESLIANAIVLGRSMSGRKYPLVLMVTADVPASVLTRVTAGMKPDKVTVVEYIYGDFGLYKRDWFRQVFTKFHAFNLVEYSKVIFLDLDILINDMCGMDSLFCQNWLFAAMENSKGSSAPNLAHGDSMASSARCGLINAGVMLLTPDAVLFAMLVKDATNPSPFHEPGMTPEQYYLARVLGRFFHHLSQLYNFEVQYHGGVPVGRLWAELEDPQAIVAFHFSGGDPLHTCVEQPHLGCQAEKWHAKKFWDEQLSTEVQTRACKRAHFAFSKWHALHKLPKRKPPIL